MRQSYVPKRAFYLGPIGVSFSDERNGEVALLDDGLPIAEAIVLSTSDAGLTWKEEDAVHWQDYKKQHYVPPRLRVPFSESHEMTARDGSQWRLQGLEGLWKTQAIVSRRLPGEQDWTMMSALPLRYGYAAGRVVTVTPGASPTTP